MEGDEGGLASGRDIAEKTDAGSSIDIACLI